jgi:hypothetical protein
MQLEEDWMRTTQTHLMSAVLFLLAAMAIAGCGAGGPLIKESMNDIRSVAVIGVYSAKQLRLLGNANPGPIGSLRAMGNLVQGKNLDGDLPIELIDYARDVYPAELAKVKRWKIIPYSRYLSSAQYKKAHDEFVSKSNSSSRWITGAKGMEGVVSRDRKHVSLFQAFAKATGADAVVVIHMDMSYGSSGVAVNGFGKARAHVGSGITVIRKDGTVLVESGNPMNARNIRVESDDALPWLAGDIVYNDMTRKCLQNAIRKSAANLAQVLNTEMSTPTKVAAK